MDNQGRQISVGNAAKVAADIALKALETGLDPEAAVAVWAGIFPSVAAELIKVSEQAEVPDAVPAFVQQAQANAAAGGGPFDPVASMQAAFPGAQVATNPFQPATAPGPQPAFVAPPSNVVPFPVQPAAPGPAPIPGAASGDGDPEVAQQWAMFFADIENGTWTQNWKDNRASKRGEKSPDFKHNTIKDSGGKYTISLWVNGKKNPSWVAGRLAAIGIS